jgi:hypothetical protein
LPADSLPQVISGVAFCPQPPLLVPAVAGGAAAELDDLRVACRAAISQIASAPTLVLLGTGPASRSLPASARGTLRAFGVPLDVPLGPDGASSDDSQLPPALTVGAWLIRDALGVRERVCAFSIGADFAGSAAEHELRELATNTHIALIVLGDGSARRSTTAPGYLDKRAAGFDATVASALSAGDVCALGALDADLGEQLLVAGVPAWHASAALLKAVDAGPFEGTLSYDAAPYGVSYFVAVWTADA